MSASDDLPMPKIFKEIHIMYFLNDLLTLLTKRNNLFPLGKIPPIAL